MTADLVEFLRARLDEDEQVARDAARDAAESDNARFWLERWDVHPSGDEWATYTIRGIGEHIARHAPRRVLAEVAAKRQIVERYEEHARLDRETFEAEGQHARSLSSLRAAYWDACRSLAAVWSDHPDYREEWKP